MPTTATATAPLAELASVGTSTWLDQIRKGMIASGELGRLVEEGVVGVTSNPSIFEKAILGSPDYDDRLRELAAGGDDTEAIYWTLAVEDVQAAADVLRPVYDRSDAGDGYVSLEVAPGLARDREGTLAMAKELWGRVDRPNAMIKIPGTDDGLDAICRATAAGINVNITLLFAVDAYERVVDAWMSGLEDRVARGEPIDRIASVASFFVSRVDTAADARLRVVGRDDLAGAAAVANAKVAYGRAEELYAGDRWAGLRERGARPQRLLWASTGTKNPAYPDVKYVLELAGPDTVNTMPLATLHAVGEHGGGAKDVLTGAAGPARETLAAIEAAGVSLEEVTDELLRDGIAQFERSLDTLLAGVAARRTAVLAGVPSAIEATLSDADAAAIEARVQWAAEHDVARRIWRHDDTLWGEQPDEIANRLGWLTVAEQMLEHLGELEAFVEEVRGAGFTDAVVLGMGGSSLAPEVLAQTFGARDGYLRPHVLDSTHPDAVAAVQAAISLETTLFIVSSKSGSTLEPLSFYRWFRALVPDGSHFAAITDPGTDLERLAAEDGFRKVFAGVPEIGGRYSALSPFGIVPAALAGVDVRGLLEQALVGAEASMAGLDHGKASSPALWLGLAAGDLARRGRDKLTFVADAPLDSFGLWAEQLVAESTGKHGTGIVPVADEPLGPPEAYGEDRVFVHVRNTAAPDTDADAKLAALAAAGHPVLTASFADPLEIGRLFFVAEFAVAVAGAVLGINAFDQPNVQEAKDLTKETIATYVREGGFPAETPDAEDGALSVFGAPGAESVVAALRALLAQAEPGSYVATMAYLPPEDATDRAVTTGRTRIRDARRAATTFGYGPRFQHSTGQLHKGGPPSGLFLQVTDDAPEGDAIAGEEYSFGALVRAQASGDLGALRKAGRTVLRVQLSGDRGPALEQLDAAIAAATAGAGAA